MRYYRSKFQVPSHSLCLLGSHQSLGQALIASCFARVTMSFLNPAQSLPSFSDSPYLGRMNLFPPSSRLVPDPVHWFHRTHNTLSMVGFSGFFVTRPPEKVAETTRSYSDCLRICAMLRTLNTLVQDVEPMSTFDWGGKIWS